MAQTYGSQIFGPLYDVVGWVAAVGIFLVHRGLPGKAARILRKKYSSSRYP